MFNTCIEVVLEPSFEIDPPRIRCWMDNLEATDIVLDEPKTIIINEVMSLAAHSIFIEFYNKTVEDSQPGLKDKAVVIKDVRIEGLSTTKISQGIYLPQFPEPWASQQREQGIDLFEEFKHSTYMGWNGQWIFDFAVPIYDWIHRTENLGFAYSRHNLT